MAYENIGIEYPNFCLSPQAGTFCTIDTTDVDTVLRVKNTAGGLISDYVLSANITSTSELLAIEYVGPVNLSGFIDGATFFTLERFNSTTCIIKRWETNVSTKTLDLKHTIIKSTSGALYYDTLGFAVEHYRRTFDFAQPSGQNYLDISSANRIESGDKLLLGPSTDADNLGAYEVVTVSFVSGNRIYINGTTIYQYVFGDRITFFNNIYVVSGKGYLGDTRYGTIIKMGAYSGTVKEYTTKGEYKNITGCRWCPVLASIANIVGNQMVFISPYASYQNQRSMFLNNVVGAKAQTFEVYDVVFDELTIYKLQLETIRKNTVGDQWTTYTWSDYNYQQDTLLPYTQTLSIYSKKQILVGTANSYFFVQARDQFGVGLRDVNIKFDTDTVPPGAEFTPLNGLALTDKDGIAYVKYEYVPAIDDDDSYYEVKVRADKSSLFTGSEYVWNSFTIFSETKDTISLRNEDTIPNGGGIYQIKQQYNEGRGYQLQTPYKITYFDKTTLSTKYDVPAAFIKALSFFGTPMGDWVEGGAYEYKWWPWFQVTDGRLDGPPEHGEGTWKCIAYIAPPGEETSVHCIPLAYAPKAHFIKQVLGVTQLGIDPDYYLDPEPDPDDVMPTADIRPLVVKQPKWYWIYDGLTNAKLDDGHPPYLDSIKQIADAVHDLHISQLKLSKHTHYVDGLPYDELFTNVRIDQFIFVEDAQPAFWSEKNPIETNIWIRLRPYAFSLDGLTLKFYIREVWTEDDVHYDTGYYDVANQGTITYFDAGGGLLGLEFLYNPIENFHHDAIVYVHIEIYDTAEEPNYIYTDYWFKLIPDYNSPYLENLSPDREEDQVNISTNLSFDIKDNGAGVDIDTLEVYLNSRIIYHSGYAESHPELNLNTTITKISIRHYQVSIDIPYDLLYNKSYTVKVVVQDVSPNRNTLRDSYRFYTRPSLAPWFTGFDPRLCKRGMPRFTDVSFLVLGSGDGVDKDTIRIQVHDKDVTNWSKITPIIYRIS